MTDEVAVPFLAGDENKGILRKTVEVAALPDAPGEHPGTGKI